MCFNYFLLCFHRPVVGPWALWENNALEIANQNENYIDYKHKSLINMIIHMSLNEKCAQRCFSLRVCHACHIHLAFWWC